MCVNLSMLLVVFILFTADAYSQEKIWGNYNVTTDMEVGLRWRELHGSVDKFRSDINLGRGPRLLGFNFESRSINHAGLLYDTLRMDSSGWGGDPNTWTRLRMEKNKFYEFNLNYRQFDYFNFLPTFALSEHNFDITRRTSDFNLRLFPESSLKLNFGYSRNSSYGSSTTTSFFGRDEFLILEPLRRENNDYRIGADWKLKSTVLSYEQSFRTFKNDRHVFQDSPLNRGNDPSLGTFLNQLDRLQPIRGFIPVERFSVRSKFLKKFDFTGRFVYSRARINLQRSEFLSGVDIPRTRITRIISTDGISTKPSPLLDLGLTYRATKKLTISDTFRFHRFGTEGESIERSQETQNNPFGISRAFQSGRVFDRFLGTKSSSNLFNLEYALSSKMDLRLGYRFVHRLITRRDTVQEQGSRSVSTNVITEVNTHTGIIGVSLRPSRKVTLFADYENGTSDNAFTRISPFRVKNWRVRAQYKPTDKLSFSTSFIRRDNDVPVSLATNRFDNTAFSISASWLPSERFIFNVGYNRMDINSEANIVFFLTGGLNRGRSLYVSNTHFVFGDALIAVNKKLDIFLGYRLLKDVGTNQTSRDPNDFINAFPLAFHQPSARISYKLNKQLRWNLGYNHYGYREDQGNIQNYRVHIAYTSLNFAF